MGAAGRTKTDWKIKRGTSNVQHPTLNIQMRLAPAAMKLGV
jgi:hypothetical protein